MRTEEPTVTGTIIKGTRDAAATMHALLGALAALDPSAPTVLRLSEDMDRVLLAEEFDEDEAERIITDMMDAVDALLPTGWILAASESDEDDLGIWRYPAERN